MLKYFVSSLILICFLIPTSVGAAPPTEANRFFIVNPNDSTVGTSVTVNIEARRGNNVDTNYQSDVTLVTGGSATGGGLVDVINGVGTIVINDLVAETVTLSLSDTQSTGLDVSSTQDVVFSAVGSAIFNQQKFWFRDDDGDEINASGFGAENVGQNTSIINVAPGTAFRLRFVVKLTVADGSIASKLEFKEGTDCATGSWTTAASVSSVFNLQLSQNFIDLASTTQQLVGGPNFIAGQILESTNPAVSLNMLKNQSTEYEWSLKASQDIPFATTYSFRITDNGTVLNTYGQCPSLTTQSPSGGGGMPATVIFSGKAFPGAKIFLVDKEVNVSFNSERIISQDVVAHDDGSFYTSFVGLLSGQHSFGLLVKDGEGRTSQTKFFDVNVSPHFIVRDIVVSPTIGFTNRLITRGNTATIVGYASPESSVSLEIDGIVKKEVKAERDGSYKAEVTTGDLDFGTHQVRAKQNITSEKLESGFSPTNILVVSRLSLPKTDLSGDGRVDIKDWSMFLSQWSSKDMEKKKIIDFNEDGKIDISDFSIFIRAIRK